MKRRMLSAIMAALLLASLPMTVLADDWYLEDGDISVSATSNDGGATQTQTVTQGSTTKTDSAPVITQRDSTVATSNNVTIESSGGATAVVTVENVNIDTGRDTSGGDTSAIDVVNGSQAIITVSGENHVNAGHNVNGNHDYQAAVHVGDSTVVIRGDSSDGTEDTLNAINQYTMGAAIGSNSREAFTGTVIIQDVTVEAEGSGGAGIGSGMNADNSGTILIDGAEVDAKSRDDGAGIGGGFWGNYSGTVIVADGSAVEATGMDGAGIGGGSEGDYSGTVIVADGSAVEANGERGAGIGGGIWGNYSGTVIWETGSTITASGGMNGKGLGAYESYEAEVKDEVDLSQYPAAPAAPTPLPWNEAMFQTPEPQPEPKPQPDPIREPQPEADRMADLFWYNVVNSLGKAETGSTVTVDAAWRTTMPEFVPEAVAEYGVTLIIQWNGGGDITLTPEAEDILDGGDSFRLADLAELLKK